MAAFSVGLVILVICHSAYSYAAPFPQGEAPDGTKYKTAYRCENEELHISCDIGESISVIRANYGRFSIAICNKHGYTDWSVNCMSPRTTRVLQTKCDDKNECKMWVNSDIFGDPCPGTHKYVEVHFACAPRVSLTTTKKPLPPWFLQGGADNLWNNPKKSSSSSPTSSTSTSLASTSSSSSTTLKKKEEQQNIYSISSLENEDQRKPILVTSDASSMATTTSTESTTPVRIPITTPRPTTTTTTTTTTTSTTTTSQDVSTTISSSSTVSNVIMDEVNQYQLEKESSTTSMQKPVEEIMIEDLEGFCPSTTSRNIEWTWTKPGETAILPCPLGTSGLARWRCGHSGLWSENHPDMSDCKSEAATNLEARVRAEDPEAVLASSLAHMTSKSHFYGGDVDTSVAVLKTIANRLRFILQTGLRDHFYNKEAYVQEVTANMIRAVSNLISEDKRMAWLDLRLQIRMKLVNNLLLALEEMAFLMADVTETPELLEEASQNILLAISVINSSSLNKLQVDTTFPLRLQETQKYGRILNKVLLPKEALEENEYRGLSKAVFFEYKVLHDLLMPAEKFISSIEDEQDYVLNSRIVSASLSQGRHIQLPEKVEITFEHLSPNLSSPICVFWNFELSGWSDSGCSIWSSNASRTVCQCDHLTNFALLMKTMGPAEDDATSITASSKLSPTTILVLEIVTYIAVALSIVFIFIILYKYYGKIVKLWEKYGCSSSSLTAASAAKQKQMHQGCPKSQSFYAPAPAAVMNNLVQVTHNPDTNLTTTNVASPQTPKTHTLSTESSRLSGQYNNGEVMRSYLTLGGQGHVTMNPYHYQNYGEDLHDGLAATLHLRDSVYMSPQLVNLTNTLRSKKKICQGSHSDNNQQRRSSEDVVFRAVSPHGHVYWEIEPKNLRQQDPIYVSSRQSSSRYSDNHPLINSSTGQSEHNGSILVNPFADVQLLPASATSSPLHYHRSELTKFGSLRNNMGHHQSPAAKLFTNRSNSARAAKMRDIAKQIEQMRILHCNNSSGTTINTTCGPSSSSGSTSPSNSVQVTEQLQQQIQIRDLKTINADPGLAKIQMSCEQDNRSPKQRKL